MDDTLQKLQNWYMRHCDGDWEHQQGIIIETLDNPGWKVSIDLDESELLSKGFDSLEVKRSDTDWFHCSVNNRKYYGYGGANNLPEILNTFLDWANGS